VSTVERTRSGCCYISINVNIIMYAEPDDILLLSPSVVVLQVACLWKCASWSRSCD